MNCKRCQGLMKQHYVFDRAGTQGSMLRKGWRCVNCGHALHLLMEPNRRSQRLTGLALPQKESECEGEVIHLAANRVRLVAA